MITLTQLEVFAAAADLEHFTQAAKALHMTQPAVSFQIRNLERELGVRLFDVRGRQVYLTEAGRLLRERAGVVLGEVAATERAMREYAALGSGLLLVGFTRTIGGYVAPAMLAAFHEIAPAVELSVRIGNTADMERELLEHSLDLALVEGAIGQPAMQVEPFLQDELVLLMRPDDPLAQEDAVEIEALGGRPFVWREPGSGTRVLAEVALADVLSDLPTVLVLDSPEAINRAVEAGLGLAVQSAIIAERDVAAGRLRALRLRGRPMRRWFSLVRLRGRQLSPAGEAFAELTRGWRLRESAPPGGVATVGAGLLLGRPNVPKGD